MEPLVAALGGFSQVGMVVSDIDRTLRHMTETLGVGPFFVLREIRLDHFRFRGAPAPEPVVSVALAQAGPVQIELVQQHNDAPSVYREFLAAGREGVQHLAVWFSERAAYNRAYDELLQRGLALAQESGSTARTRSAFFETEALGGLMIELSESRMEIARGLGEAVAQAARDWDGLDPVRPIRPLA